MSDISISHGKQVHAVAFGVAAMGAAAVLAGCGASVTPAPQPGPVTATGGASATSPVSSPPATPSAEHAGQGFKVTDGSGNVYTVYLTKVIDPAQGADSFTTPDNGKRFVGAVFTITGVSGTSSDDANNDAVLVGSDGQTYTPDFSAIAGYTNFSNGEFSVGPHAVSVGAVTFQVPDGVKVASVQWNANSGFGGAPGVWVVRHR